MANQVALVRRLHRSYHPLLGKVGLAVMVVVAVGACGGSASSSSSNPIVITAAAPFSGNIADFGQQFVRGSNAAIKEIEANGGLLGRPISLNTIDTKGDTADETIALQQMLAVRSPAALLCGCGIGLENDAALFAKDHVPVLINAGFTAFDTNSSPWLWRVNASDSQLAVAMALDAKAAGYTKAATMFTNGGVSEQALGRSVASDFVHLGGTVVSVITLAPSQPSYLSEDQRVVSSGAQVVFTQTSDTPTFAGMFKGFAQLGVSMHFVGSDATTGSDYIKAITPLVASKQLTSVIGVSETNAANDAFVKYYHIANGASAEPQANENYAYDSVILLGLAMEKANSSDGNVWNKDINQVSNPPGTACYDWPTCTALLKQGTKINYEGASGPLDFNQNNNVYGPFAIVQVDAATGQEHVLQTFTAAQLAQASP